MLQCFNASMLQCFNASMLQCFNASMLQCWRAKLPHSCALGFWTIHEIDLHDYSPVSSQKCNNLLSILSWQA